MIMKLCNAEKKCKYGKTGCRECEIWVVLSALQE